jgi:phosphonate degradation associated HDIG domain protein
MKPAGDPIGYIVAKFDELGHRAYGEEVTLREHMLEAATFAEQAGESDEMVIACLLHDFGHFVAALDEDAAGQGIDGRHEVIGAAFLSRHFSPAVVEPGRLHVDAKRYLCAVDPDYARTVSPASLQSLALQGGPFTIEQARAFEQKPFWREAIRLRRFDEQGKVPGMQTPGLDHFLPRMERCLRER